MENLRTEPNQSKVVITYSNGILYSVMTSLLLTLIIDVIYFTFNLGDNKTVFEALFSFMGAFVFFGLIIGLITLVAAIVIGIPTVMILGKQDSLNCTTSGFIGAISTAVILLIMLGGNLDWQFLIIIMYGFACGYAFMRGYKNGGKHEKI